MTSEIIPQILTSPAGPSHGPVASALALGAPEATRLGFFWNHPGRPGAAPGVLDTTVDEHNALIRRWRITSRDTWLTATDALIRGLRVKEEPTETALDVRDEVLEQRGAVYLSLDDWLPAVNHLAQNQNWSQERTDLVLRSAVKLFHAERQLADDGLLPAGHRVVTMYAYDLAHAAYLTQAGCRMGYTDQHTVQQMLDALAHNAAAVYPSWAAFGAAYVLACSAINGGYPTDDVYRSAAGAVHLLLSSPVSPWTNIAFPTRP